MVELEFVAAAVVRGAAHDMVCPEIRTNNLNTPRNWTPLQLLSCCRLCCSLDHSN